MRFGSAQLLPERILRDALEYFAVLFGHLAGIGRFRNFHLLLLCHGSNFEGLSINHIHKLLAF